QFFAAFEQESSTGQGRDARDQSRLSIPRDVVEKADVRQPSTIESAHLCAERISPNSILQNQSFAHAVTPSLVPIRDAVQPNLFDLCARISGQSALDSLLGPTFLVHVLNVHAVVIVQAIRIE